MDKMAVVQKTRRVGMLDIVLALLLEPELVRFDCELLGNVWLIRDVVCDVTFAEHWNKGQKEVYFFIKKLKPHIHKCDIKYDFCVCTSDLVSQYNSRILIKSYGLYH